MMKWAFELSRVASTLILILHSTMFKSIFLIEKFLTAIIITHSTFICISRLFEFWNPFIKYVMHMSLLFKRWKLLAKSGTPVSSALSLSISLLLMAVLRIKVLLILNPDLLLFRVTSTIGILAVIVWLIRKQFRRRLLLRQGVELRLFIQMLIANMTWAIVV